jgi:hypothetical protein
MTIRGPAVEPPRRLTHQDPDGFHRAVEEFLGTARY